MLIVIYFASALIVDSLFRRASFCKYVCPVGQFNFAGSTVSPLEVAVRDQQTCTQCETKDCIRGVRGDDDALPIVQRGCELALFQPRKVGNLDCTFCLDCVYACPHDNVGILTRIPAAELEDDGPRSGLGTITRRFDMTALAVVFLFGALLNAFAMISPVYVLEQSIADFTGLRVEWPILGAIFTVALVLEPAILLGGAAWLTRRNTRKEEPLLSIVNQYARTLFPLGFGIWLAHYGFHFFTGCLTVIPVAQNAAVQTFGSPLLGEPRWQLAGLPESVVFPMEVGFMSLGLIGSLTVAWAVSHRFAPSRVWGSFWPWAILHVALFIAGISIMTQPMDMRGTFLG
jgi:ferredoxin